MRDAGLGEGRIAAYSNQGSAGEFNELHKEGGEKAASIKGGRNRIMHAMNTSPSIISFYTFFPHPFLLFRFLVFSAFSFQFCRDLRLPPLPSVPPRFLAGSDCLKIPDSAEKEKCFLACMAEGRERRVPGLGGEETTQLNTNPIS